MKSRRHLIDGSTLGFLVDRKRRNMVRFVAISVPIYYGVILGAPMTSLLWEWWYFPCIALSEAAAVVAGAMLAKRWEALANATERIAEAGGAADDVLYLREGLKERSAGKLAALEARFDYVEETLERSSPQTV